MVSPTRTWAAPRRVPPLVTPPGWRNPSGVNEVTGIEMDLYGSKYCGLKYIYGYIYEHIVIFLDHDSECNNRITW